VNIQYFGWTVVIVNCFHSFVYGYTDTVIFLKVSHEMQEDLIEKISRYVGLANQFGAFLGSVLAFLLVIVGALQ